MGWRGWPGCWGCPQCEWPWPGPGAAGRRGLALSPHLSSSLWAVLTAARGREAGQASRLWLFQNRLVENCSCNLRLRWRAIKRDGMCTALPRWRPQTWPGDTENEKWF